MQDLNNLAVGDNYQRQMSQNAAAVTSKYKRSNSLMAPPSDSKTKLVKKVTESMTSPAAGGSSTNAVQYNYNYQKQRVGHNNKYDSGESDGTPTNEGKPVSTKAGQSSFSSKAR